MKNVIILILLVKSILVFGQNDSLKVSEKIKKNVIFVELGGNGIYGSVNYNRVSKPLSMIIRLSLRIGVAANTEYYNDGYPIVPLIEGGMLLGKKRSYFEFGFGINFHTYKNYNYARTGELLSSELLWEPYKTLRIGYRFQKPDGGIFISAALTPIIGKNHFTGSSGFLWGGIGIGYCF